MIKIISSVLLIAGFSFGGRAVADMQREKCLIQKNILSMLSDAENRLRSLCLPLSELIFSLSSGNGSPDFIKNCSRMCSDGTPFPDAWRLSLENDKKIRKLPCFGCLLDIGSRLGTGDITAQLSVLEYCIVSVTRSLAEEEEKSKKYSQIFPALGILAGIWTVIIIV